MCLLCSVPDSPELNRTSSSAAHSSSNTGPFQVLALLDRLANIFKRVEHPSLAAKILGEWCAVNCHLYRGSQERSDFDFKGPLLVHHPRLKTAFWQDQTLMLKSCHVNFKSTLVCWLHSFYCHPGPTVSLRGGRYLYFGAQPFSGL